MNRLLIVGVETTIGQCLARALSAHCLVSAVTCTRELPRLDGEITFFESIDAAECGKLLASTAPNGVIFCGEVSRTAWDVPDAAAIARETDRFGALSQAASSAAIHCTLISSDAVCRGPQVFCDEAMAIAPGHALSDAIRSCEQQAIASGALVLRTHAVGCGTVGQSFAERMLESISENRPPILSESRYATPIHAVHLAHIVRLGCERRLTGLYHAAGAERASQWEFAVALAGALGCRLPPPRNSAALNGSAGDNRELETSLDSRRLQRVLSLPLPLLVECVAELAKDAANLAAPRRLAA